MAEANSSFWGPVTSRFDWCEKNYVRSSYIAEFFNTISNMPGIILAFIGLVNCLRQRFEKRFSMLHISNMILGIGSILYHASLQNVQQQSDETPMVWEMLLYIYILYSPDWHYRSTIPTFLCLYGALFALVHALCHLGIIFKVHYAALCFLCIPRMYKYYIHTNDVTAQGLAKRYIATLFLACFFWLGDRILCTQLSNLRFNPQGHAIWHVLMSLNSYYANTFLMFCRAQQRGWAPKVAHFLGVLPYIKIEKPKSQ